MTSGSLYNPVPPSETPNNTESPKPETQNPKPTVDEPEERSEGGQFEMVKKSETFGEFLCAAFYTLVSFEVQFQPQTVGGATM